jgi:hypothetical protein
VFKLLRVLQNDSPSHDWVRALRRGAELIEMLLLCQVCYDISKPPRVTLHNVLLLGRLFLGVTAGYQEYLKWAKQRYAGTHDATTNDTVYLSSGDDADSMLGFEMSGSQVHSIIIQGLQRDGEMLSRLGQRFAVRQLNRHHIGHQTCPDTEGRCWKEREGTDPDPSDVCPWSPAARALTPCYRIVDEVRCHVQLFQDAIK